MRRVPVLLSVVLFAIACQVFAQPGDLAPQDVAVVSRLDAYGLEQPFATGVLVNQGEEAYRNISLLAEVYAADNALIGEGFGFLGFYLARPEHRGKGYGLEIWKAGMDYMGARNVGLDGVVAQQDNYRRSGFVYAYGNVRYEGALGHSEQGDGCWLRHGEDTKVVQIAIYKRTARAPATDEAIAAESC